MDSNLTTTAVRSKVDAEPIRSWGIFLVGEQGGWMRTMEGKYIYYLAPGPAIAQAKRMNADYDSSVAEAREFPLE